MVWAFRALLLLGNSYEILGRMGSSFGCVRLHALTTIVLVLFSRCAFGQEGTEPDMAIDPLSPGVAFFLRNPALIDGSSLSPPLLCEATDPSLWSRFREYYTGGTSFWSHISCEEAFSESPPEFVRQMFGPQIRALAPWRPFCSQNSFLYAARNPEMGPAEALAIYIDATRVNDTCGDSHRDRYVMEPAPATTSETPAAPWERAAGAAARRDRRSHIIQRVEALRTEAAAACCGTDERCREFFGSTVYFCDQVTDPAVCRRQMAGYRLQYNMDWMRNYFLRDLEYPTLGTARLSAFPFAPIRGGGFFYFDEDSYVARGDDLENTIRHEFGHVCSNAILHTRALDGDAASIGEVYLNAFGRSRGCDISANVRNRYRELYSRLGLSEETSSCLFDVAAGARLSRYAPTTECATGCPRTYLEEAVGVAFPIILGDSSRIASIVTDICSGWRDSEHPLSTDVLTCLLRTPTIRNHMYDWIGCRR